MKFDLRIFAMIVSVAAMNCACALTYPRVEQDLKKFDGHVDTLNKEFSAKPENLASIEWVKAKLTQMVEVDQYMRNYWSTPIKSKYSDGEKNRFNEEFLKRNNLIDSKNTADIKTLLKKFEWFKISVFGEKADREGWLLVQHADLDVELQKQVLTTLERLVPLKETNAGNYAYLYDRVASSFNNPTLRKPQRYGTQGQCVGTGKWEPWPIEDEANVDKRRKSVGLKTLVEYKADFKDICP